jgi:hypothetical protein
VHDLIQSYARQVGATVAVIGAIAFAFTMDPRWVAFGVAGWLAGQGIVGLVALRRAWLFVDDDGCDLYYTDCLCPVCFDGGFTPHDAGSALEAAALTPAQERAWRDVVAQLEGRS